MALTLRDFFEEFERRRRWRRWGRRRLVWLVVGVIVAIWLLQGIYIVGPGEVGVVRQFGREIGQTGPGLHYHLPWPIQRVNVVNMAQIRRAEIGFRTVEVPGRPARHARRLEEALMLTGDENIAEVQLLVQYKVKDASAFLFKVREPEKALRMAAEVAIRSVIGKTTIDEAMTVGRPQVEADTLAFLQRLLDDYQAGLHVVEVKLLVVDPPDEVKDAFHEVVRALEDKSRLIREAEGYAEDLIPKARGEAEKIIKEAEAYKEERIKRAEGDATEFLKVLAEYKKAPEVTRERLYLEAIERILAGTEKFVIDPRVGELLQLLPLTELGSGEKGKGKGKGGTK
ncbi:TPA: FtsH protease activity modulator HflK [Candidatus Bipolaricaulota bacterium]|nr:FtsH protease activity modulator HflK [Candidatus Bipolaricaulota bacterium]